MDVMKIFSNTVGCIHQAVVVTIKLADLAGENCAPITQKNMVIRLHHGSKKKKDCTRVSVCVGSTGRHGSTRVEFVPNPVARPDM